jgi:hypothetical protein
MSWAAADIADQLTLGQLHNHVEKGPVERFAGQFSSDLGPVFAGNKVVPVTSCRGLATFAHRQPPS